MPVRRPILTALTVSAVLVALTPAVGQPVTDDVATLQARYRDERIRARRLRADAAEATASTRTLERRLATLRDSGGVEDPRLGAQRARLKALGDREARLVAALSIERNLQGRLLSALQTLSRDPPPAFLIPATDAIDAARAGILMRAMLPELQRRADALTTRQTELARIRRLAALSSERLFTIESARTDRRAQIEGLIIQRTATAASLRAEAALADAAARGLETRLRALGSGVKPLREDVSIPITRNPAGRSRLSSPVPGAPVTRFGAGSSGWRWRAPDEAVISPADAVVDHVGPLPGWGQVVILDLGPGWRAVVAGIERPLVQTGARVAGGASLGRTAREGDAVVYFELRRDERPVDPAPWLE